MSAVDCAALPALAAREALGGAVLSMDDTTGAGRLRFVPGAQLNNIAGTVFGGYLAAMIDDAAGIATWFGGGQRPFATAQMSISFLRAARSGEALIADVSLNCVGVRQAFVEVRLNRERDGQPVAIGTIVQSFTAPGTADQPANRPL